MSSARRLEIESRSSKFSMRLAPGRVCLCCSPREENEVEVVSVFPWNSEKESEDPYERESGVLREEADLEDVSLFRVFELRATPNDKCVLIVGLGS